jgi:hypothetical protein
MYWLVRIVYDHDHDLFAFYTAQKWVSHVKVRDVGGVFDGLLSSHRGSKWPHCIQPLVEHNVDVSALEQLKMVASSRPCSTG